MSLRIAATRLTELHTVKLMIGGNGGVIPSSDSQTLNVCDGGAGAGGQPPVSARTSRYIDGVASNRCPDTERAPFRIRESVVSLVGLAR